MSERPPLARTLTILCSAAMAFALAQTALVPAIDKLKEVLHTGTPGVTWTLTGYLVCAAVMTPIFGRLGDMFGKKRMLVVSIAIFALGNLVSGLGDSLGVVVAGRVVQGAGGGIFPLCFAIIRDEFPRERVATSIGFISAISGIGGGFGLVAGGVLVDHVSFHWIFWMGAAVAALTALFTHLWIPESPVRSAGRVDVRGATLLTAGLVPPLVAISQANRWGWGDARILALLVVGASLLVVFGVVERRTAVPLANFATLVKRPVLMTNLATLLTGFGLFGSFLLIPQLAETPRSNGFGFGASATEAGLLMLPGSLVMLGAGPLSGRIGNRFGNRVSLGLGAALAATGQLLLALVHDTRAGVLLSTMVLFGGVGLAFSAMPNLIVDVVPQAETGEATGFNALVRSVGSSLGTQISAAVLAASIVGTAAPTEASFRAAFLLCGAVAVLAALAATAIPPLGRTSRHLSVSEELGAASPLAEPPYSGGLADSDGVADDSTTRLTPDRKVR